MLSQGAQFGDSVFEGLVLNSGCVLFESDHMSRLFRNAKSLSLNLPSLDVIGSWTNRAVSFSGYRDARIRLTAYRGVTGWGISSDKTDPAVISIMVVAHRLRPASQGIRVITAVVRKCPTFILDMRIKCGANYFLLKRAATEAANAHADDALLLSADSFVSEATVENVFWVSGDQLLTPEVSEATNCLPGITRQKIIQLARKRGIRLEEGAYHREVLDGISEMFLTGTSAGVVPVLSLDGRPLESASRSSLTIQLATDYQQFCEREALQRGDSGAIRA
jgi:branched-chain amino acid aminotransferase